MQSRWQAVDHAEVDASWGDHKLTYKNISEIQNNRCHSEHSELCARICRAA